jgi:hypothetical protein
MRWTAPAGRRGGIGLGVLAMVLLAASPAQSARYADPNGTGVTCSEPAPCSIVTAIEAAPDGSEVILKPGTYGPLTSGIHTVSVALDVHGAAGAPRPLIVFASSVPTGLALDSPNVTIHDLEIEASGDGTALELIGTGERLVVTSTGLGACHLSLSSAVLRDSVCRNLSNSPNSFAAGMHTSLSPSAPPQSAGMRNVTAYATGGVGVDVSAGDNARFTLKAVNVVAHGGSYDVRSVINGSGSTSATLILDHSNYATYFRGPFTSLTLPGSGSNQTSTPLFANPGAGDFHQLAGSATIDAGVVAASNGAADLDGEARTIGGSTDIGADEYSPAAPPTAPAPGPIADRTAPRISRASMLRRRFRVGSAPTTLASRSRLVRRGSAFRFTLSEAARVRVILERRVIGRRSGRRCLRARRRVPPRLRCVRRARKGVLGRSLVAGRARIPFSGRVGRRALRPGHYYATLIATDAAGNRSTPVRLAFTILR